MKINIILILLHFSLLSYAQDASEEIQKVFGKMLNSPNLYMEQKFAYFEADSKQPVDTFSGVYHKNGKRLYQRMGDTEMLDDGSLNIAVDHEEKIISVSLAEKKMEKNDLFNVGKLSGLMEKKELDIRFANGSNAVLRAVEITNPDDPSTVITLRYQPTTWIITESIVTLDDPDAGPYDTNIKKVRVSISYVRFATESKAFPYKTDQYVVKKDNHFLATGKCKGYQII